MTLIVVLGAMGAFLILVLLMRLRPNASAHPRRSVTTSDSSLDTGDSVKTRTASVPSSRPASSFPASSAVSEFEQRAGSRVRVCSPIYGSREIDLSFFGSTARAIQRSNQRDSSALRKLALDGDLRKSPSSPGTDGERSSRRGSDPWDRTHRSGPPVGQNYRGVSTEQELTYILVDEHGKPTSTHIRIAALGRARTGSDRKGSREIKN